MGSELIVQSLIMNILSLRRRRKVYIRLGFQSSANACRALANHARRELRVHRCRMGRR